LKSHDKGKDKNEMGEMVIRTYGVQRFGVILLSCIALNSCTSTELTDNIASVQRAANTDPFAPARRSPLSASAHYVTAVQFLSGTTVTQGDLEMALNAFRTSARIAPDLWEPLAGAAFASYALGNFSEALETMGAAVVRKGSLGSLAMPLALMAYRAGEPELARLAFGQITEPLTTPEGRFLSEAYSGIGWRPAQVAARAPSGSVVGAEDARRSVRIEAYMIRDRRDALGSTGLSLLDALSVQFGGTLINYSYEFGENGSSASGGNVSLSANSLAYSLNVASRNMSHVTLEASPIVIASEGSTSSFVEGTSILVVPLGGNASPIERDIGISMEVTPQRVSSGGVDLDVTLEMSALIGQTISGAGRGASVLETDKSVVTVSTHVPYGSAIVVGSSESLLRRQNGTQSLTNLPLPGLSNRGSSARSRAVLVLLSVRSLDETSTRHQSPQHWAQVIFGQSLPSNSNYGRRPSELPNFRFDTFLPTTL
jgi:hypothetical protein